MKYVTDKPCTSCGRSGEPDGNALHHIYGRKAHGVIDEPWNLMPLCFKCHRDCHDMPFAEFAEKNIWVQHFLVHNGWEKDEFLGKWIHEKDEEWAIKK